jgi:hypothetical protein
VWARCCALCFVLIAWRWALRAVWLPWLWLVARAVGAVVCAGGRRGAHSLCRLAAML